MTSGSVGCVVPPLRTYAHPSVTLCLKGLLVLGVWEDTYGIYQGRGTHTRPGHSYYPTVRVLDQRLVNLNSMLSY